MAGLAAWTRFGEDPKATAPLADPDNLAQFQTLALSAAINLNEDQMQQIDAALFACMQDASARGLFTKAPPPPGDTAWWQTRMDLQQRAFNAVNAFLTPEQSVVFTDLQYAIITFGGGPGISLSRPTGGK